MSKDNQFYRICHEKKISYQYINNDTLPKIYLHYTTNIVIVLNQFAKMRDFLIFMTNNKIVLYYNRSK